MVIPEEEKPKVIVEKKRAYESSDYENWYAVNGDDRWVALGSKGGFTDPAPTDRTYDD